MTNTKHTCPIFDESCPYCLTSGECTLENPLEDCETYWWVHGEDEEEEEEE